MGFLGLCRPCFRNSCITTAVTHRSCPFRQYDIKTEMRPLREPLSIEQSIPAALHGWKDRHEQMEGGGGRLRRWPGKGHMHQHSSQGHHLSETHTVLRGFSSLLPTITLCGFITAPVPCEWGRLSPEPALSLGAATLSYSSPRVSRTNCFAWCRECLR